MIDDLDAAAAMLLTDPLGLFDRSVTQADSRVRSPVSRTSRALITGDSVSATRPDMITAMASVNANSLNSTPVRPERKPMGA